MMIFISFMELVNFTINWSVPYQHPIPSPLVHNPCIDGLGLSDPGIYDGTNFGQKFKVKPVCATCPVFDDMYFSVWGLHSDVVGRKLPATTR